MLKVFVGTLVAVVLAFVGFSFWVSRPAFDEARGEFRPLVADRRVALTFARANEGLILVLDHDGDGVRGVSLLPDFGDKAAGDLIAFLADLDESQLPDRLDESEWFPIENLRNPLEYTFPYIAAGTNFKEHADEVYSDDPPFLFPKLAKASRWNDGVPFTPRLDFEAELCMFPLADISSADELPGFGLVLCNDFTDRWTLVAELDLTGPLGLTGFASGKGCPGCMPTGYLVLVPRSPDFYRSIELSLYVNDRLRQRFSMRDVILPIEGIVAAALSSTGQRYKNGAASVALLPKELLPQGTLILTGTAAGVIFKPANIWSQGFYLEPGDIVRTEATYLGHLENRVTATR